MSCVKACKAWCSVVVSIMLVPVLTGCSGNKPNTVDRAQSNGLQAAVDEINAAPVPTGVAPAVFAELKAELTRILTAAASKTAAKPPSGDYNKVETLRVVREAGDWYLEWEYLNTGDYSLDGEVNINDLTPVGQFFNAQAGDANWELARWADGDGNGVVNINDVTPIGQNYKAFIHSFHIYATNDLEGDWTQIGEMSMPATINPAEPLRYDLAENNYNYYRIQPFDNTETPGPCSCESMCTLTTPEVDLGDDTQTDSTVIDSSGGTLTGPDLGNGAVELRIGAGAIISSMPEFRIGSNNGEVTRDGVPLDGHLIYIEASEYVRFANPAFLVVPLPDDDNAMALAFRVLENGGLVPLGMPDISRINDQATFFINLAFPDSYSHAASSITPGYETDAHIWIMEFLLTEVPGPEDAAFTCNYRPAYDGFNIQQLPGLNYQPFSFGVGTFACWYYYNYQPSLGSFSTEFSVEVQETIAKRATISTVLGLAEKNLPYFNETSMGENFETVKQAILHANGPVFIEHSASADEDSMSKVAYAYQNQMLLVNEYGKPGEVIKYDVFDDGATLRLVGTDDFPMHEPFENILLDATDSPPFGGANTATINITSHTAGEPVSGETATLSGYITSGVLLIDQMVVWNSKLEWKDYVAANIPLSGDFEIEVPLVTGENKYIFATRGETGGYMYVGANNKMNCPNNLDKGQFWLKQGPEYGGPLYIEMTWPEPAGSYDGYLTASMLVPMDHEMEVLAVGWNEHGSLDVKPFCEFTEDIPGRKMVHRVSQIYQGTSDYTYDYSVCSMFYEGDNVNWEGGTITVYKDGTLLKEIAFDNTLETATDGWPTYYDIFTYNQHTGELTINADPHWHAVD